MASLQDRMMRAAKLDANLYEEVEADQSAMGQAITVVVIASVAAGIGQIGHTGVSGIIGGTIAALIGWFIWALVTYLVGTKMLPEAQTSADLGELLRTIGFASSPGIIRVLGIIPGLYWLTALVGGVWMLVAMVIAVRQALDYNGTGRAIAVCVIGWLLQTLVMIILLGIFGLR